MFPRLRITAAADKLILLSIFYIIRIIMVMMYNGMQENFLIMIISIFTLNLRVYSNFDF